MITQEYSLDNLTAVQKHSIRDYLLNRVSDLPVGSNPDLQDMMTMLNISSAAELYTNLSGTQQVHVMVAAATLRKVTRVPDDPQLNPAPHRAAPVKNPKNDSERARAVRIKADTPMDSFVLDSVAPNPKRAGSASAARYDLYKVGLNRRELISLGLTNADIKWDLEHSYITFGPQTESETPMTETEEQKENDNA